MKHYAVLEGGPAHHRLVLVDRGQTEFQFPIEACACGVIQYDRQSGALLKTFTYTKTEHRLKGLPVFTFKAQPEKEEEDDESPE